jgi:Cdc6-like AAA superfamily ATPase
MIEEATEMVDDSQVSKALADANRERIRIELRGIFTPGAPINRRDLFAGRLSQIDEAIGAVSQVGQHAVIFGERGVGKTSLAGIIHEIWRHVARNDAGVIAPRVNCETTDTFQTLWSHIADEIQLILEKLGGRDRSGAFLAALAEIAEGGATPHLIRRMIDLADEDTFIIVIDELDRLSEKNDIRLLTDTIKTLSDHWADATLILVGVADAVDELIEEHASIDRALVQIAMPRMSRAEMQSIVSNGLERVGMDISTKALTRITEIAQGLPYYAHLLALTAATNAIERVSLTIEAPDVEAGIKTAIDRADESVHKAYDQATSSPRKENLYRQVLAACAKTSVSERGYFYPADVKGPMSQIMGKQYEIPAFIRHLHALCTPERGSVLQKTGEARKQRFRFANPLLKPYVYLRGVKEGLVSA